MRKFLVSLGLFFVGFLPAFAGCDGHNPFEDLPQAKQSALRTEAAAAPYHEGLLWHAENGNSQIYILGTMHIPDPRLEPIYSAARTHLAGTDLLMLETTKAGELAFHRRLTEDRSVTFITSGPNLEERLGKDAWSRLVPVLAEHQVPLFAARMMQPWFLGLALATPPCARSAQATGQKGLDRRLERLAQSADIPQAQLDDPDQLLAMLAGDPIEDQIDMMRRSLQGEVYRSNETAGLSALYFSQEPYLFWLASAEISRSTPGFDPDLLEEVWSELIVVRNQSWLPKILDVAKTQTVFVAVGALHLPTRDGVLHGLAEAGYTLRRLPVPSR